MATDALYEAAFPYADDVLSLPVSDVDEAAAWYVRFGMVEVERSADPVPRVVMERDSVRIGFAVNGGNPESEGAAIRVTDVERAREELVAAGVAPGDFRIDESDDGSKRKVFFVVAPDGLCYYFHQPIEGEGA